MQYDAGNCHPTELCLIDHYSYSSFVDFKTDKILLHEQHVPFSSPFFFFFFLQFLINVQHNR